MKTTKNILGVALRNTQRSLGDLKKKNYKNNEPKILKKQWQPDCEVYHTGGSRPRRREQRNSTVATDGENCMRCPVCAQSADESFFKSTVRTIDLTTGTLAIVIEQEREPGPPLLHRNLSAGHVRRLKKKYNNKATLKRADMEVTRLIFLCAGLPHVPSYSTIETKVEIYLPVWCRTSPFHLLSSWMVVGVRRRGGWQCDVRYRAT